MLYEEKFTPEAKERVEWLIAKTLELQSLGLIEKTGDFVPSVHYPPITQYDDITDDIFYEGYVLPEDGRTDLYLHFPFCIRHCTFCHYPGLLGDRQEEKKKYLDYLKRELDLSLNRFGLKQFRPRSILLGGGTPTYMPPAMLEYYLKFVAERVDLPAVKQYNVDLDPNSLVGPEGLERIRIMKEYGVTRLTIGIQSFDPEVLRYMNRPHDPHMALESIENTLNAGLDCNIEFIYGYPGDTMDTWLKSIDMACHTGTHEIQIYRLKVQAYGDYQGHILDVRLKDPSAMPTFEQTMRMKANAIELMRTYGYEENLRRVYTRKKRNISQYAYNQCCNLYDQLGFGLTGFSSLHDRFSINTQHFQEYYDRIDAGHIPLNRGLVRDAEQQIRQSIALPTKNMWMIKRDFEKRNGIPFDGLFKKKVQRLVDYGLLMNKPGRLELTELGKFVADEVVEQFNSPEYLPFPRDHYADGPLNPYLDNTSDDAFGRV